MDHRATTSPRQPAAPILLNCRMSPRTELPSLLKNYRDRTPERMNTANPVAEFSKKDSWMSNLSVIDAVGFVASGLVLATFCMRSMSTLRWVAIASNVAFITYGYLQGLAPVLLLHMLLLPVNICQLALRSAHFRTI